MSIVKNSLYSKLPQLQNLIKRDPSAYKEEFVTQKQHYDSEYQLFLLHPTKDSNRFTELINFLSHVMVCYKEYSTDFIKSLLHLLESNVNILHPDVRAKVFQSLILMRNKSLIDPIILIQLSFKLFVVNDKTLRITAGEYIFNDIKNINTVKRDEKLNRQIQAKLFTIVAEDTSVTARKTVQIMAELYRRRIWTDVRTVNVIASACFNTSVRVVVSAINFFLGIETKMHDDDDEEKPEAKVTEVDYHEHSKKTKKRQRHIQKQVERNSKLRKDSDTKSQTIPLFPAILVIHDPQTLAEKLFTRLRQSGERFEVKLLFMNFISRLIGCHKLLLLSFYSFLQKYLISHQTEVTLVLAYLIQSCHELVPPEELVPVIKTIAYHFISERNSNEVLAVGLNSVREIIIRSPAILREPDMDDFIQDLAQYGRKTHKSVMIAAHGIVNLVRDLYPALLRKGDRGKFHNISKVPAQYGAVQPAEGVDGADLLDAYENGQISLDDEGNVGWKEDGNEEDEGVEDVEGYEEVEEEEEEEEDDDDEENEYDDGEDEMNVEDDDKSKVENQLNESKSKENVEDSSVQLTQRSWSSHKNIRNRVDARRVLTDADFALIEKLKQARAERLKDPKLRSKMVASLKSLSSSKGNENHADGEDENHVPVLVNSLESVSEEAASSITTSLKKRKRMVKTVDETTSLNNSIDEENTSTGWIPKYLNTSSSVVVDDEDGESGGYGQSFSIDPTSLAPAVKSGKTSKIDRIMNVLAGRKEVRFVHEGHKGGLTNKEKLRKKNFMMIRKGKRDVSNKINKSHSDVRYEKNTKKEQYGRDLRKRRRT